MGGWSEQPPFKSKIWDNRLKNCEFLIPMDYIRCSYEGKMTFNALSQRIQDQLNVIHGSFEDVVLIDISTWKKHTLLGL